MADIIPIVQDFLNDMRGETMNLAPVVKVEQGELKGRVINKPSGRSHFSFHGIPYAKPPVGDLRFKAPVPPDPWQGVLDATEEGNDSAQIDPVVHKKYVGDEDCLYLNIYTPNLDGEFLPVMVFIHGGEFKHGSSSAILYDGEYLIEKDVIVVTLNYRCGPLGFLCLNTPEVPGNAGLKDMVQAVRWVEKNIHAFGGNARNITVFGGNAGSICSSILTASPLTKGLISKVILQSGTALHEWTWQKDPIENARRLAKLLSDDQSVDDDKILKILSEASAKAIVEAHAKLETPDVFYEKREILFCPVVEKEFVDVEAVITEPFVDIITSGRLAHIPTMIGITTLEFVYNQFTDDFRTFVPNELHVLKDTEEANAISEKIKDIYFKKDLSDGFNLLISDILMKKDVHRYVNYLVQNINKPTYLFNFDYVGGWNVSKCVLGDDALKLARHGDEMGYLFKNYKHEDCNTTPEDLNIREIMISFWTNFAKAGNPTPDDNESIDVTWIPVTKDNIYYLNISSDFSLGVNPDKERMEFWNELYNKYYKVWKQNRVQIKEDDIILKQTDKDIKKEVDNDQVDDAHHAGEEQHIQLQTKVSELKIESFVEKTYKVTEEVKQTVEKENVEIIKENSEEKTKVVMKSNGENGVKDSYWIHNGDDNAQDMNDLNFNVARKPRTSNEIKMLHKTNGEPKDVVRANDPPEDDLPKNIGVNKFVNFFESLGAKK